MVLSRQLSQQGKGVGSRIFLPPVSQTYPFLRFSGLKLSKRGGFEKSSPTSFSNLPFFGLKASKRGRFEKSLFLQTTTFPVNFLKKGGLSFELEPRCLTDGALVLASGYTGSESHGRPISQTYPFLRFPGLKPTSFSNLPFFELFRAESFLIGLRNLCFFKLPEKTFKKG